MTNVLDRLHEDHEKVSELIAKLKNTGDGAEKSRDDLCRQIKQELEAHTTFEEEVFYPAVRKQSKDAEEQVDKAIEEHGEVEQILEEIESCETGSPEFMDLVENLEESIEAHVQREEEEIFPMAKQALDENESERLGQQHDSMVEEHMRAARA